VGCCGFAVIAVIAAFCRFAGFAVLDGFTAFCGFAVAADFAAFCGFAVIAVIAGFAAYSNFAVSGYFRVTTFSTASSRLPSLIISSNFTSSSCMRTSLSTGADLVLIQS
jgi:hypothetical protein